jgi:hypothetical protein
MTMSTWISVKPRARVVRVRGARADGSSEERRRSSAQKLLDALARGTNDIEGVRKIVRVPPAPCAMVRAPGVWGDGLHWRHRAVPNVENAASRGCELTQERYGRRMRDRKSNAYMVELFETASSSSSTSLNRFDLFHAHAFAWRATNESSVVRLGILFHAKEYPAKDDENFPIDLGKCQCDSTLCLDEKGMSQRNVLWLSLDSCALLAWLDTSSESLRELLTVPELHTTFEGDFGAIQGDVYYFHSLKNRKPSERLFIIPR